MRACILGVGGLTLSGEEAALLRGGRPAGVILFGRNVGEPTQLRGLIAALRAVLPEGAVMMVDQEGGRVARLRPPGWAAHPSAAAVGAAYARDAAAGLRAAWLTGALIGAACAEAGFDVVTAPVLDVPVPGADGVIGDRAFSDDPRAVSELGRAVAEGLLAAGVQPVGKHAPGHGRARADSHLALPELDDVSEADLAPFCANASLPWMMTAHVRYRALDDAPATVSARVIREVIRGRIGFDGVLVSDDLAMAALSGTPVQRAQAALAAGCDLALYCSGDVAANAALLEAVPEVDAAAVRRLAAARARRRLPMMSEPGWRAEQAALLHGEWRPVGQDPTEGKSSFF